MPEEIKCKLGLIKTDKLKAKNRCAQLIPCIRCSNHEYEDERPLWELWREKEDHDKNRDKVSG